jgi:hypothetical protein
MCHDPVNYSHNAEDCDEVVIMEGATVNGYTATITLVNPDNVTTQTIKTLVSDAHMDDIKRKKRDIRSMLPSGEARRILSVYLLANADPTKPTARLERVK